VVKLKGKAHRLEVAANKIFRTLVRALVSRVAQVRYVFVIRPLPVDWLGQQATPLVEGSAELLNSEDSEQKEDEEHEDDDVEEGWQRTEQRLNRPLHARKSIDAPQGSKDSECAQRLVVGRANREKLNDTDDHDSDIEQIPRLSHVGVVVLDEAHGDDLHDALKEEKDGENLTDFVKNVIPVGLVFAVRVVRHGQAHRVQHNQQDYEVFEFLALRELNHLLAELGLVVEQVAGASVIDDDLGYWNFLTILTFRFLRQDEDAFDKVGLFVFVAFFFLQKLLLKIFPLLFVVSLARESSDDLPQLLFVFGGERLVGASVFFFVRGTQHAYGQGTSNLVR